MKWTIIIVSALLGIGTIAFGAWYWARRRDVAKAVKMANPAATPEQIEALTEEAIGRYLDEIRAGLSGSLQIQWDRTISQLKGLAKRAKGVVVKEGEAEGEPEKA